MAREKKLQEQPFVKRSARHNSVDARIQQGERTETLIDRKRIHKTDFIRRSFLVAPIPFFDFIFLSLSLFLLISLPRFFDRISSLSSLLVLCVCVPISNILAAHCFPCFTILVKLDKAVTAPPGPTFLITLVP